MCRSRSRARLIGCLSVVLALLAVAWAPQVASAQAATLDGNPSNPVRHTLVATVGNVTQVYWSPFTRHAASGEWSATGRVRSNVPVVAIAHADGDTPLSGWQVRVADGRLVPWDGREIAVSAPLGPGASDVSVHLVAPRFAADTARPAVRLTVKTAPRP